MPRKSSAARGMIRKDAAHVDRRLWPAASAAPASCAGLRDALDADAALARLRPDRSSPTPATTSRSSGCGCAPTSTRCSTPSAAGGDEAQGWGRAEDSPHRPGGAGGIRRGTAVVRARRQATSGRTSRGRYWLGRGPDSRRRSPSGWQRRWGLPEQRHHPAAADDGRAGGDARGCRAGRTSPSGDPLPGVVGGGAGTRTPAQRFVVAGLDRAAAAPGVLDAMR
jgi:LPPG:FO 2-phospho-L-lactate transferase